MKFVTAQLAIDEKVKNAELEEMLSDLQDEIRRLKGEKKKTKIKPANTKELNPAPKKARSKKKKKKKDIIRTACVISVLRNGDNGPPIRFLVSDDGTNFIDLIKNHQLCWGHEIRN